MRSPKVGTKVGGILSTRRDAGTVSNVGEEGRGPGSHWGSNGSSDVIEKSSMGSSPRSNPTSSISKKFGP